MVAVISKFKTPKVIVLFNYTVEKVMDTLNDA